MASKPELPQEVRRGEGETRDMCDALRWEREGSVAT